MKKLLYLCCGILCAGVVLTSCGFRNVTPSVKSYVIHFETAVKPSVGEGESRSPLTLKLLPFRGAVPFRTTRIYYRDASFSLNAYVFSRWAISPNVMLQMKFVKCLEAAALFHAVLPSTAKARADLLLETTLYDFSHHIRSGNSSGVIAVEFRVVDTLSKKVLSTLSTTIRKPTPTPDAPGAVDALDQAADTLGRDLVRWLKGVVRTLPGRNSR